MARLDPKVAAGPPNEGTLDISVPEPEVLHTHSDPEQKFLAIWSLGERQLLEAFNSILTTHKAIRPITKEELKVVGEAGKGGPICSR